MNKTNGRSKQKLHIGSEFLDRQPPFDLQAEIGVLGSMVLLADCIDEVAQVIVAEDFYDSAHRIVYRNIVALYEAGRRFDVTLLIDRLKVSNEFELVGGTAYLSKIINSVPNAAHAVYYAEIVRNHSTARKLIHVHNEGLSAAYDHSANQEELVASAEAAIARVSDSTIRGSEIQAVTTVVPLALQALEERMRHGHSRLLNVGLSAMANCMGLVAGGVTLLAGRPSQGKSAALVSILRYVARHRLVAYCATLEMTAMELTDRILSAEASVPYFRMLSGNITQEQRERIVERSCDVASWNIDFDDRPGMTLNQISASARRQKRRHGRLDLLAIDYLQLVTPDSEKENRVEQLDKIARSCKRIARELQVPVLGLVQVNRQATDNAESRPRLQNLKGSGGFEEHSDSVVFVHRPAWYKMEKPASGQPENAEIIVEKNRNGPTGIHEVYFWPEWMDYTNKASEQQEASGTEWNP